jgi:protocatechuate 3,4-dioxygenase beta subunit
MKYKAYGTIFALVCLIVFFPNCGGLTSTNSKPPVVAIMMTTGSPQIATVGTPFAAPLVVTVTTGGSPTSGVSVTFTAPTTGASGTFANGMVSETDTTNASGVVRSSTFTANSTAGPYTVTAVATGAPTPVNFGLKNTVLAAAIITATGGTPQTATVGAVFAASLTATVLDSDSNPVTGAAVTFMAPATGASGTFAKETQSETDATNASGVASSSPFTANPISGGPYPVTAIVAGVAQAAHFSLTNIAGAAAMIAATGGTPQAAAVGSVFAAPLVATVVDSDSNPVSGAAITFIAPRIGASGTFANGTSSETDTTNTSGVASSSPFTANPTVGGFAVTASISGATKAANFSLTNTAVVCQLNPYYQGGLRK